MLDEAIRKNLEKKITPALDKKWRKKFERQATYIGNEIYSIPATNLYSNDTRELFLMFVAACENIPYKKS